jgi:hypothetical protein
MVSKMVYTTVLHAARLMKFLSVRKGASGPLNIGENEFALAGAVKEVVTRWRSSSPKKKGGPSPMSSSSQAGQLTSSQAYDIG